MLPLSIIRCKKQYDNNIIVRRYYHRLIFRLFLIIIASACVVPYYYYFSRNGKHSSGTIRHPLSPIETEQDQKQVRYLTFGSSSTWGKGLEDMKKSYPWLLSPEVHNVASRDGGPSISALCTQSIVGDQRVYDVIVIEFLDDANEGLLQLASRMRKRFPSAAIVFVQVWNLGHIVSGGALNSNATTPITTVSSWWNQKEQERLTNNENGDNLSRFSFHSDQFREAVLSSADAMHWSFTDLSKQKSTIQQALKEVNGHLYQLPYPDKMDAVVALTNPSYAELFQENNLSLLSEKGHDVVAKGILDLLQMNDNNLPQGQRILNPARAKRDLVGSWEPGDYCSMWYSTGVYNHPTSSLTTSSSAPGPTNSIITQLLKRRRWNSKISRFSMDDNNYGSSHDNVVGHKYAYEVYSAGGSIELHNPFNEPRMLYLTYMTSETDLGSKDTSSTKKIYPKTKVVLGGKPTVMLNPIHDITKDAAAVKEKQKNIVTNNSKAEDEYFYYDHHITRTTAVGIMPPGDIELKLQPVEASKNPFRLVGISILEDSVVESIPFDFAMERESTVERRYKSPFGIIFGLASW